MVIFLGSSLGTWLFLNDPPSINELLYVANIQEYGAMYGSFVGIISDLWRQNIIIQKSFLSLELSFPFLPRSGNGG